MALVHPIEQSRFSRRRFLKSVALMAGAGLAANTLVACVPSTGPAAPAASNAATQSQPSGEQVTLQMWAFASNRVNWENAMIPKYEEQLPGFTVNITTFPYADMHDKLLTALQAGTGAPDIGDVARQEHSRYLKGRETLIPLDDLIGDELNNLFQGSAVAEWSYQGKIYGLGNELNACLMFYRHDLLSQAGIDVKSLTTWEKFREAGSLYNKQTGKLFVSVPDQDNGYWTMLSQGGGGWFDEDGNCNVDTEFGVRVLQMLHDWVHVDKFSDLMPGGNAYNSAWYGALTADESAIVFGAPWYQGFMKDNVGDLKGKWEMTPFPLYEDGSGSPSATFGGTGMTITEQCQHKMEAWEFIKLCNLTVDGQITGFDLENLYPTYKPAWEDERLFREDDYFNMQKPGEILQQIADEMPLPSTSVLWHEVDEALTRLAISPVMTDKISPEDGLAAVCDEVESVS